MNNNLEARNPKYNVNGGIDLEINHPKLGWIMFSAFEDDVEEHGRVIFVDAKNGMYGDVEPYVEEIENK